MPSRHWGGGSTRRWRQTRLAILKRDQWRCQINIPNVCTTRATCVHHIRGKQHGDDPQYLLASCQACNLHLGDVTVHDPSPKQATIWE